MTCRPHHDFEVQLSRAWPESHWSEVTVLLAVSGGPDSMCMLHALRQLHAHLPQAAGRIEVAHFNHGWRGEEANRDEQLVATTCESHGLIYHRGRAEQPAVSEQEARDERYEFLIRTAHARGARYLATAHTRDDQVETILHRILRGTGLRGLSGIRHQRRIDESLTLVRPLLWAERGQIHTYLRQLGLNYSEDATNQDCRFTRNRIRHQLLPQLAEQYNPEVSKALLQLGALAGEAQAFIEARVRRHLEDSTISQDDSRVVLDNATILSLTTYLRQELFLQLWRDQGWPEQAMSFDHWSRLAELARGSGAATFPGGIQVRSGDRELVLESKRGPVSPG